MCIRDSLSGTRLEGAPLGATNRLYKNNRDGTFTDVTKQAGLESVGWANAVCVGDYNNDGYDDLFCTYFGQDVYKRQSRTCPGKTSFGRNEARR